MKKKEKLVNEMLKYCNCINKDKREFLLSFNIKDLKKQFKRHKELEICDK